MATATCLTRSRTPALVPDLLPQPKCPYLHARESGQCALCVCGYVSRAFTYCTTSISSCTRASRDCESSHWGGLQITVSSIDCNVSTVTRLPVVPVRCSLLPVSIMTPRPFVRRATFGSSRSKSRRWLAILDRKQRFWIGESARSAFRIETTLPWLTNTVGDIGTTSTAQV